MGSSMLCDIKQYICTHEEEEELLLEPLCCSCFHHVMEENREPSLFSVFVVPLRLIVCRSFQKIALHLGKRWMCVMSEISIYFA